MFDIFPIEKRVFFTAIVSFILLKNTPSEEGEMRI
jgi:hypothetical protein